MWRIQIFQLGAGSRRSKTPLNYCLVCVARLLPDSNFSASLVDIANASVQTLVDENREFDFDPIQPTAMQGGVMPFNPFCEAECFFFLPRFCNTTAHLTYPAYLYHTYPAYLYHYPIFFLRSRLSRITAARMQAIPIYCWTVRVTWRSKKPASVLVIGSTAIAMLVSVDVM